MTIKFSDDSPQFDLEHPLDVRHLEITVHDLSDLYFKISFHLMEPQHPLTTIGSDLGR